MRISFYFDPSCPWTWMTSRWLVEVQQYRDLDIAWKPFSLEIKNAGFDVPAQYRPGMRLGLRALRVIEAAKAEKIADIDSVGRFYTVLGQQFHNQGLGAKSSIAEALSAAKWPAELHYNENNEELDLPIRESMREAMALYGTEDTGVPLLVLEELPHPVTISGPILNPAPRGEDAALLWDAFVTVAKSPNFYELKKHRDAAPMFD
ncbi:MAG: disulfide bond formation protein DsbA [Actinomycetota bacterium]|nr:MAG: disulfide bond formation protein DsbA [Actinomycetota bacterium]